MNIRNGYSLIIAVTTGEVHLAILPEGLCDRHIRRKEGMEDKFLQANMGKKCIWNVMMILNVIIVWLRTILPALYI